MSSLLIDCSEPPFVPEGLFLLPESEQLPKRVRRYWLWDVRNIGLHLPYEQRTHGMRGTELLVSLRNHRVFPANILDFCLKRENKDIVPKEFERFAIPFWGSLFGAKSKKDTGIRYVRCLYRDIGKLGPDSEEVSKWEGGYFSVNEIYNGGLPTIVALRF